MIMIYNKRIQLESSKQMAFVIVAFPAHVQYLCLQY